MWKSTFANYPPTIGDTITASAVPAIVTGVSARDTTLTGWTTAVAVDDCFIAHVVSCTDIKKATLVLMMQPAVQYLRISA